MHETKKQWLCFDGRHGRSGFLRAAALVSALASVLPVMAQVPPSASAPEEPAKRDARQWDVNNPPGPQRKVAINTSTGTWMSLDVSPDGREIVFDLLGDIYKMPAEGGEAQALTTGVAWDMQPRFSPDGKRIAFTSDRGGGDNIWIMSRDGARAEQVTKEDFRLLNSPAWTPDGQYIAAHKHFATTVALGAGEIWLYHSSGGAGTQMTKRQNDLKNTNEPAFSPDGRYLYFSQDTSAGSPLPYDKNPHSGIYGIQRLDRTSGELLSLTGGKGGAIRPTPSPDGETLAFVRRVDVKTALFVRDLRSGRERLVFNGLDRDMQETWGIHGMYPSMAWTPDSQSVVLWAQGKIWRVDVATGEACDIPFHVTAARQVTQAVRTPIEVAPTRFQTKMLRWAEVSPRGDRVLYQALGHLYIRKLPDGVPQRLTQQTEHFESHPSFSRDGKSIVFATWDDETLGSIRVVPVAGGRERILTQEPGHYIEPVFSPDGKQVVYRKTGDTILGGGLMSPLYSAEPGLYVVAAQGGESRKINANGVRPQFGSTSDRVFFTRVAEDARFGHGGRRSLYSTDLRGADEREHFTNEAATEYRISPDGKWLAFSERFNVYITPFVLSAFPIDMGPASKALPVAKVSANAGQYLHFSGDSKTLFWSLGQELFSRNLTDVFGFLPGAPDKLPEPEEHGRSIGFEVASDVPEGSIALVGARIVTMRGDEVIENGTVVVEKNRIVAVGPRSQVSVPAAAKVIDVTGKTLLPGLIDVHWHGVQGDEGVIPEQNYRLFSSLSFGVTTAHDPSSDTDMVFAASELARAGVIVAPRLFSTGTPLTPADGDDKTEINNYADALRHLKRMKAVGAFTVKSYILPRREQRQQIVAAARELNMMVVPEGGALFEYDMNLVVDGHTGVEHNLPVARIYDDVLQLWSGTEVGYTPTLVVSFGGVKGEAYWYQHTAVWKDKRLISFVPEQAVRARARRGAMAGEDDSHHIEVARGAKALLDRGVKVHLGAHGQREGLGAHWELWSLGQGGMTPLEAIRSGTLYGAEYLGLDRDLGSIEVGKLADIIVLDKNPLENLRNSESVSLTMLNGRLFDAATLEELGNHPRKRKPFYFERDVAKAPALAEWSVPN